MRKAYGKSATGFVLMLATLPAASPPAKAAGRDYGMDPAGNTVAVMAAPQGGMMQRLFPGEWLDGAIGRTRHLIYASTGRSALGRRLRRDAAADSPKSIPENDGGTGPDVLSTGNRYSKSAGKVSASGQATTVVARRYLLSDLGTLGGAQSFAYALNDAGQVTGYSWVAGGGSGHSFLYGGGRMTDLFPLNSGEVVTVGPTDINNSAQIASGQVVDGLYLPALFDGKTGTTTVLGSLGKATPAGFSGVATGINEAGQAVGYSYVDGTIRHAFVYKNGVMTDIDVFGGYSEASAINNAGLIVGFFSDQADGAAHAFVYAKGGMTDIGRLSGTDPAASESYARDVNNHGQVVGEFLTADKKAFHAFMYRHGVFTDLGAANSPETSAFAINDRGQVVGTTYVPYTDTCFDVRLNKEVPCIKHKPHGFLYQNGRLTDLNGLFQQGTGWEIAWAFDINNKGRIVGYGLLNGQFRAYLLTPVLGRRQCENDRWKSFVGFQGEPQCLEYVSRRG
jgi:probable HAF family extracellular repeat protein